ncbi:TPA: hypothetical protein DEB00_04125 [Candidatus Uhrbacteria bacterium]|nr:hypothetical protein [Candidatus Uhrbacteria bacterium]
MGPLSELALFISINWRAHARISEEHQGEQTQKAMRKEPIDHILEELGALSEQENKTGDGTLNTDSARAHLGAMLLNVMRYCDLAGIEGDSLGEWIADYYRSLPPPSDEGILEM